MSCLQRETQYDNFEVFIIEAVIYCMLYFGFLVCIMPIHCEHNWLCIINAMLFCKWN